ncbi:MotA/TolQ/ExbB proton channel family protein [Methylophaga frappieri]|uniref:MotA/TolQ/ExbB proton channel family protein n=1 Tax=Methylophaga frappieri (strain ATCC BAA-2434 / DSM 25690 / JAM7) TaxID=754477 RepID=I1YHZ6_METFJ|nr:MotA/TolQ/ExbB proton channel family protein [Methylophaga frappieri]AFJ02539.1 MotA/TolQ/ExbB proton channel family protein [Methylophaga frappieri]
MIRSIALFLSLFSPVLLAQTPSNLDELLEQVKKDRVVEQQQNELRLQNFIAERDQQAQLLEQAKAELAAQERRGEQLNGEFEANEELLAEQESLLQERSGSLGELFGTVRQIANDSRGALETSVTSLQYPERNAFLQALSERRQQPTIDELQQLWLTLQQEMTESGKVETFTTPVITATGEVEDRAVTRVGVFTFFADGKYLRYLPETQDLVELARQPVPRLQDLATQFEQAEPNTWQPTVVDPTRGAIMALLVQTPNLKERIQQGGWIGYIIIALGVIGLLIALLRFVILFVTERGVRRQQKRADKPSAKNPLGRILSVYDQEQDDDVETLSLKLDEAILRETPALERGLTTLAILAAVAPMLGLLGTVSGMIETFQAITLFGTGDPKLMSGGISQALVTTELGLAVAIPILLIHSALSSKSNRLIQILDEESAAIVARNAEQHNNRD